MTKQFDAVVIGAGIIGTSIAFSMSKAGWRVLVVDPLAGAGQGATSSSVAMVRTQYSTREGSALAWEGFHCWQDWGGFLGLTSDEPIAPFHLAGVLTFKTANNGFLKRQLEFSRQLGIPFEAWPVSKLQSLFPKWDLASFGPPVTSDDPEFGARSEAALESVFFPKGGYCPDPQLAAHNLQRAAEQHGAHFRFGEAVTSIDTTDHHVSAVTLSGGERISCRVAVNAAGPHGQSINALAELNSQHRIQTRVVRHEVAHIRCADAATSDASRIMLYDTDIGGYIRADTGDNVLAGSLGARGEVELTADPDKFDRNLSPQSIEPLYRLAQRIPSLGIPNTLSGVADLWDVSDDWIPIYDCTDVAGFYMAIGTSGNQFKTAPVVGELMTALISACEQGANHDRDPIRFQFARTGHEINLGFFSRNREPNPASSLSVLG
jgi:sarcosine oxidase subunit beta